MEKIGLVLEGGAMRGLFTVGVLDVLMEHEIAIDGIVGVSAGAAFGCNYKSKQPGRAIRYNKRFAKDKRYCSLYSLITTGDLFGVEFCYHVVPTQYDIFDTDTFEQNPIPYYVVVTNTRTGEAEYKELKYGNREDLEIMRASASQPVVSHAVRLGEDTYLDGGLSDSIPLKWFESQGFLKNLVILTQPEDYVKQKQKGLRAMKPFLKDMPAVYHNLEIRHNVYNQQTAYVKAQAAAGQCFVIQPEEALPIGRTEHDPDNMQRVYEIGRKVAEQHLPELEAWISAVRTEC